MHGGFRTDTDQKIRNKVIGSRPMPDTLCPIPILRREIYTPVDIALLTRRQGAEDSLIAQANRGFAFALFYAMMNVAALSVGVVLDFFRISIRHGMQIPGLPPDSLLNSGLRLFILTGTGADK